MYPYAIAGLGGPELLIILAVLVLMFGASKLPELARGSGRALRIFKAETKGLMDDDDVDPPTVPVQAVAPVQPVAQVQPVETVDLIAPAHHDTTR